jgi:hypothetical protein
MDYVTHRRLKIVKIHELWHISLKDVVLETKIDDAPDTLFVRKFYIALSLVKNKK